MIGMRSTMWISPMSKILAEGTFADLTQLVQDRWKGQAYTQYVLLDDIPMDVTFTGQSYVVDHQRYYLVARWFDPNIGIFISGEKLSSQTVKSLGPRQEALLPEPTQQSP